jgi:hypothetical protein
VADRSHTSTRSCEIFKKGHAPVTIIQQLTLCETDPSELFHSFQAMSAPRLRATKRVI